MSNILYIELENSEVSLQGLPLSEGQYFDGGEEEDGGGSYFCYVDLGDKSETTVAQEQYLNTQPGVISYWVK